MIEHLFISKVRVKILRLFFLDITKEVHIRGIVRQIEEEINAVRRELKNLKEATVLKSEKRGNRVYYSLDMECPLYIELLGIIHKEFGVGGMILQNTDRIGKPKYSVLSTAFIQNHHPSQYDIDLLLVGDLDLKSVAAVIKEAEAEINREIRYTVMPEEEFEFRKRKRDTFLTNITDKHMIVLIGDVNKLLS